MYVSSIVPLNSHQYLAKKASFAKLCGYTPHSVQMEIHKSTARFRVAAGGSRSGKSMAGGFEAAFALSLPARQIWVCSSVYELALKEFRWAVEFLSRAKLRSVAHINDPKRGSASIYMPWGSFLETKSSHKPETLLGEELDLLLLGEASQLETFIWERYLRRALGSRLGVALALSTPNWDSGFFRNIFELGNDPEQTDYESWQFSVLANPYFSREEYDQAVATLPQEVIDEQYDGKFTSRRGATFPQFSETKHVIPITALPEGFEHLNIVRTINHDKNAFNNPIICLYVAVDLTNKRLIVYDEYYQTKLTLPEAIEEIAVKSKGKRIITTLTDFHNPILRATLKKHPKIPSVTTNDEEKKYSKRHSTVRRLQTLQTYLLRDGDIQITNNCVNLIRELKECRWPEPKSESMDKSEDELPPMKHFGSPSALSYLVAWLAQATGYDVYTAQLNTRKVS